MKKKNDLLSSLRLLGYLTQFGLSVILPPLLLTFLGWWLSDRYGIGVWLIIVLLLAGLISSGCSFYRFFKTFVRETRDEPYEKSSSDKTEADENGKGDRGDEV
ncbi:MAG: AtpZ/AtpI family protein [Clostridia bacterium]|nr:AtpZ/AtpI family protein [Clostridia bacterium]